MIILLNLTLILDPGCAGFNGNDKCVRTLAGDGLRPELPEVVLLPPISGTGSKIPLSPISGTGSCTTTHLSYRKWYSCKPSQLPEVVLLQTISVTGSSIPATHLRYRKWNPCHPISGTVSDTAKISFTQSSILIICSLFIGD